MNPVHFWYNWVNVYIAGSESGYGVANKHMGWAKELSFSICEAASLED